MSTVTLTRQRLVGATFNATTTDDAYRLNSLRDQADEDNRHDPFTPWEIVEIEIVHTGERYGSGKHTKNSFYQAVYARVTEKTTKELT